MSKFNRLYIQSKLSTMRHKRRGSQIAELPPALILLFFVLLFPFLNMLYLICTFTAGWYLNSVELREVACSVPGNIGFGLKNPPDQAYHTVVLPQSKHWNGTFGVSEDINSPQVAQFPPAPPGDPNTVATSKVRTIVNISPLVRMRNIGTILPLGNIPGLGKPFTFVYNGTIQQEEPGP